MLLKGSKCKCDIQEVNAQQDGPTSHDDDSSNGSISGRQFVEEDEGSRAINARLPFYKGNQTSFCSTFCKRLGPKQQKRIILECLNIELNNLE